MLSHERVGFPGWRGSSRTACSRRHAFAEAEESERGDTGGQPTERMSPFDVLTMGRVGVDLYPEQSGIPLAEVSSFAKSLRDGDQRGCRGCPLRVPGRWVITKVGADGFGNTSGRRCGLASTTASWEPTPRCAPRWSSASCSHRTIPASSTASRPPRHDHRHRGDRSRRGAGEPCSGPRAPSSAQPSRDATLAALGERGRKPLTIHDLDYRPMFWSRARGGWTMATRGLGARHGVRGQPRGMRRRGGRRRTR